jgi:PAS domain S-box-containing protein
MNPVRFKRMTTLFAIAAATCIGIATLLLAYSVGVESKRSQDYRAAFAEVAKVMTESPTPYVRLDSNDAIRDFSGSFLQLMGRSENDVKSMSGTKFRSLLANDESRKTYDDVENRRRTGDKVDPYHVRLRRADNESIQVKIVSAPIPDVKGGELPETFGLLLTQPEENTINRALVEAAKRSVTEQVTT